MRRILIAGLALIFIASCSSYDRSPDFVTYKTLPENPESLNESEEHYNKKPAIRIGGRHPDLDSLIKLQHLYYEDDNQFDIAKFRNFWNEFVKEESNRELTKDEVSDWVELTGFLFQLTGEARIAEEFERIVYRHFYYNHNRKYDLMFMPYIFTRHTDKIHVNLYMPAEINFIHSLGGKVTITQQTDFPKTGRILLVFGMETKQYVELFVRIPSWAENASVTVGGVKYLASPGSYSHIAKKWKEGDEVEVLIPLENLPAWIKPVNR